MTGHRHHDPNDEFFYEDRDGYRVGFPYEAEDVAGFRVYWSVYDDIPKHALRTIPKAGLLFFTWQHDYDYLIDSGW